MFDNFQLLLITSIGSSLFDLPFVISQKVIKLLLLPQLSFKVFFHLLVLLISLLIPLYLKFILLLFFAFRIYLVLVYFVEQVIRIVVVLFIWTFGVQEGFCWAIFKLFECFFINHLYFGWLFSSCSSTFSNWNLAFKIFPSSF